MSEQPHFRNSPRPHVACRVDIQRLAPTNDKPIVAFTRDIGQGGLFASTTEVFEMGEAVEVVISTPSTWEPVRLPAVVCWCSPDSAEEDSGVGLSFTMLSDAQVAVLGEFVAALDFES